jgi:N-acetylglucosamine-6-sulfatase
VSALHGWAPRVRLVLVLLVLVALLGPLTGRSGSTAAVSASATGAATGPHRPSVVVILTDDQRTDSLLAMPSVRRLLVDQGTRFTRALVPTSICCPSRSAILTGLYSHDNGVWANGGKNGGWRAFHRLGNERRTIATTLHRAGYRTALVGKYLNGLGHWAPVGYRPPGWDRFEGFRLPRASRAHIDKHIGKPAA